MNDGSDEKTSSFDGGNKDCNGNGHIDFVLVESIVVNKQGTLSSIYWTKYEEREALLPTSTVDNGSVDMAERFKNLRGGVYLVKNTK